MKLFNRRKFIQTSGALAATTMIPVAKAMPIAPKIESPFNSEVTPTGIPGLDELLDGGLHKKMIYLILGQSGSGKSRFISQVYRHCKWNTMSGPNNDKESQSFEGLVNFWEVAKKNCSGPIGLWTIDGLYYGPPSLHQSLVSQWKVKEIALENNLAFLATVPVNRAAVSPSQLLEVLPFTLSPTADVILTLRQDQGKREIYVLKNRHGKSDVAIPWNWKGGFTPPTRPAILTPATFS